MSIFQDRGSPTWSRLAVIATLGAWLAACAAQPAAAPVTSPPETAATIRQPASARPTTARATSTAPVPAALPPGVYTARRSGSGQPLTLLTDGHLILLVNADTDQMTEAEAQSSGDHFEGVASTLAAYAPGGFHAVLENGRVTGTVGHHASLQLRYSFGNGASRALTVRREMTPSGALPAGRYGGNLADGDAVAIELSADGTFAGRDDLGCRISGTLDRASPPPWRVSLSRQCGRDVEGFSGLAAYRPPPDHTPGELLIVAPAGGDNSALITRLHHR